MDTHMPSGLPMLVAWLRELADKGGSGVVNNVDARSLGRAADELNQLRKALRELLRHIEAGTIYHAEAAIEKANRALAANQ